MSPVEPFAIRVPDRVLDDLQERLARTRWPDQLPGAGWDYGTDIAYLRSLVDHWRNSYDWRRHEAMLNTFANFRTVVDGQTIHFIRQPGQGPRPLPLMLLHGWPGSVFEMYKIIGPLADPKAHGGDPADAFDVVVPSLPGYGFSGPTTEPGTGIARMAEMFAKLMAEALAYPRFAAHGTDWGALIATALGADHAPPCLGIHLTMVMMGGQPGQPQTEEEREELASREAFMANESAYLRIQGTKPQTLAYALNDSPVGLAAWIVEKFRTWSDCRGDLETRFTKDDLLTNIMLYWVTETINSSMRLYYEFRHNPWTLRNHRVEVPTGVAVFPADVTRPARSWAQRGYNIRQWTRMPRGGHFAALEEPELLVEDIRSFFRPLRG